MPRPPQEVGHLPAEVLFYPLPSRPYTCILRFSGDLGAGGMRAQPVKIRRPLRSNGQRVVNDTQELSSNPFCKCKYFSYLLSKLLGRPRLRARTALPPANAL